MKNENRSMTVFTALVLACFSVCGGGARERTPAMERLPPGSVNPQGWLRGQLELQRDGLTGNAEKLYKDIGESDWLTGRKRGGQFSWERGPYYAKGLTSLAFALDDAQLKARAGRWIEAYIASQKKDGSFGTGRHNWWANMIVLWTLRDWCEATGDRRVVPFLERYFRFQRGAFASGVTLLKDSPWAVARAGDEIDVVLWLYRKTGSAEWLGFAKELMAQTADWTTFYHKGGRCGWGASGYRAHIVNFMQGLKTPPLRWLLSGDESDRTAVRAAFSPDGWAMKRHGRPDRMVNGSEPLSGRSSTEGTELCATAERILSSQVVLEILGDCTVADDLETVAYNTLPATLSDDGKGMRYYCLLNQPKCANEPLRFLHNGHAECAIVPGPYSGFGCCRSNFHLAWPKFCESMWMKRDGGLAAVAYGDCTVRTPLAVISETGGYPFSDSVTLRIVSSSGKKWPLYLRIPGWSDATAIAVNAEQYGGKPSAGTFVKIDREWKKGDVVEIRFSSKPVVSYWKDDSIAVKKGALLYALDIKESVTNLCVSGNETIKRDAQGALRDVELGFPMRELRAASPWDYALVVEGDDVAPRFETRGDGPGVRLAVKAVRTDYAGWGEMRVDAPGRAEETPPSPVPSWAAMGETEEIELVPLALTQLRITLFPWVKK